MRYLNWPDGRIREKSDALAELGIEITMEEFIELGVYPDQETITVAVVNNLVFEAALLIDEAYALQVVKEDLDSRPCRFFWVEQQKINDLITQ